MKSILVFILSVFSVQAFSMELGTVSVAGTGCFGSTKLVPMKIEEGRYALPLRVRANKAADAAFDRKACSLRIPISVGPNEKLQLVNASQVVRVVGYKGSEIKTSLNLGFVGKASTPMNYQVSAAEDDISSVEVVKYAQVLSESDCGKNVMLSGNLNALINGNAPAFVSTGAAIVTLKVVSCSN